MTATIFQEQLRGAGLRVTAPRLAVLHALQTLQPHRDVDAIASDASARLGTLSTQSVYDNLRVLVRAGIVRRIEPAGSAALYELRVGDNHHHVVCRVCAETRDIDCVIGAAPCLDASAAHGFQIDEAEVIFWGLCPKCRIARRSRPGRATPSLTKAGQRKRSKGRKV